MIFALDLEPLHGGGPMQVQNPYMGVDPCLISNFEFSGHQFGTILKSFILTFQCASIQPSPVAYCLTRMQETRLKAAKTPGTCFFWKKNPAGLHHTEDRAGDAPKPIQNGNAQIDFKCNSN